MKIVVGVAAGLLLIIPTSLFLFFGGDYYFDMIKRAIFQKAFLESECVKTGGVVVSSNEIGIIVHYPGKTCAYPYADAEKGCYDDKDCQGACILRRFGGNERIDNSMLGRCQKYRNDELNCVTERRNGKIITHWCVME